MIRVLRWTVALFGIGLIVMTGMLETIRLTHEADPVLLIAATDKSQPDKKALYLLGAGVSARQRLSTFYYAFHRYSWSADKKWYYVGGQFDLVTRSYLIGLRISSDGRRIESFEGGYDPRSTIVTPDGKWALYTFRTNDGPADLMRVSANTDSTPLNLTPDFAPSVAENALILSDDSQWVYIPVTISGGVDYYRIPIAGGDAVNVTAGIDGELELVAHGKDFLVFQSNATVYLTNGDGGNPRALLPAWAERDTVVAVRWAHKPNRLLIETRLRDTSQLWMFEVPSGRLQWRYDGFSYINGDVSEGAFIAYDGFGSMFYVRADGRVAPQLVLETGNFHTAGFSENGNMTFLQANYLDLQGAQSPFELWFVRMRDGIPHRLSQHLTSSGGVWEWSWDGEWATIRDFDPLTNQPFFVIVDIQGARAYPLDVTTWLTDMLTWLPPIDRAWSPIGLLVMGSVLMLGGIMRRGGRRKI